GPEQGPDRPPPPYQPGHAAIAQPAPARRQGTAPGKETTASARPGWRTAAARARAAFRTPTPATASQAPAHRASASATKEAPPALRRSAQALAPARGCHIRTHSRPAE